MSAAVHAAELVVAAAHPEHFVLLGVVAVIGLVVFAVSRRRRKRQGREAVDELDRHDLSTENTTPTEQPRHQASHHGSPAEQKHHDRPH